MSKINIFILIFILLAGRVNGQSERSSYQYPEDSAVRQKIEQWQDLKFGLFMHWGAYSQRGIVESWSLCPEDHEWNKRTGPYADDYFTYVQAYEKLQTTFNPLNFNPDKWAEAAKNAGMKYVVFTTKHHDGFNMFDTRQSDYKITSKSCPFSTNPRANVTKEIFNSFRKEGFMIGGYYSISDWHNNDFWWDYFPPFDRRINYSPIKYPEKWNRLNDFIYNQLGELTSGEYGQIDLLWFDLCDISKERSPDWERYEKVIRGNQPGTIMVARHTNGPYENYRTPEQKIPDEALDYPWETCMTMGDSWSYKPNDRYKSTYQLIQLLVQIVSRGGNFLLNIGPSPDGDFDPVAYDRLKGIGNWMKINSEAIYETKSISPYHETKLAFTQKENNVYAFYLADEDEKQMPGKVLIHYFQPVEGSQVFLLGHDQPLKWEKNGKGFLIHIPKTMQIHPVCQYVWTFKFQVKK